MASVVTPLHKIHETAIIEKGAEIGKNVVIGPYAVIMKKARRLVKM